MNIVLPTLHVRRSAQSVPLAAGCLAAAMPEPLRSHSRLLDLFPQQTEAQQMQAILALEPDLLAFPLYLWNRQRVLALTRELRRQKPGLWMVAGGPEATADPQGVLAEGALNGVICGEGETTFSALAQALQVSARPDALPGLILARTPGRADAEAPAPDLQSLPSPWLAGTLEVLPGGGALWEISRGCPFGCDYCFDARGSHGVRHLPWERLEAELELFVQAGVSQVWVLDSTFNFPPQRGKRLLHLLAKRAPHIHFHLEAKADYLDAETAKLLGRLNCSVQVGLQTIHPQVLRNVHRPFDPGQFRSKIHLLAAEQVTYGLDLIYGLPGDNYRGFCASLEAALKLAPNHLEAFVLAVLPGTALHRDRQHHGIEAQPQPPYELQQSKSWSPGDLERSRLLAAALDLFYNTGRAVGFFQTLVKATGKSAVAFLEGFAHYMLQQPGLDRDRILETEPWQPAQLLPLQEEYVADQLKANDRSDLLPAALDLLRFHFHYAQTLLGPELIPPHPETLDGLDLWNAPLQTAAQLQLVAFNYEILDLLEMGEADLEQIADLFRPVGSVALFARRGEEVLCESLEEDFLRLLNGCRQGNTAKQVFAGSLPEDEGVEIVEFAIGEGFLKLLKS